MNNRIAALMIFATLSLSACSPSEEKSTTTEGIAEANTAAKTQCPVADASGAVDIAPGLSARIIRAGEGRPAVNNDYADTNVWLWQYDESAEDRHGAFIWESGDTLFQFQLGAGQVIKGWDLGVPCMLEGEIRELVVASELGYGASGRGSAIPPNTPLIFTIELVKLTAPQ